MCHTQPCKHFLFPGILLAFFFLAACNHNAGKKKVRAGFSDDTFSETLQQILKSADTTNSKAIMPVARSLRYTYFLTGYQPIWVRNNFLPTASSAKLIEEL